MLKALLLALALNVGAQERDGTISVSDCRGGLNTRLSGLLLQDNESPATENMVFDETGACTKRDGSSQLNTSAIGDGDDDINGVFQLEQADGDKYCVAFSSTTGYYSTDGCVSFTAFVSTLTRNNDVNCTSLSNNLYCVNDQYNFIFDGTQDLANVNAPANLDFITTHRNYCFGSGNDANPSRFFWSGLGNCASWTTSTDYVDVNADDGDVIVGIGPPISDIIPIYKKFSTWGLEGSKPSTWKLINLSKTIGAKNHRSIVNFDNKQCFDSLGPNGGQPGIYCHNIVSFEEASAKVRSELESMATFSAASNREIIDSFSDWDSGDFGRYALSSLRDPGFMQSSHTTISHTVGGNWAAGTLSNVSTFSVAGSLVMVQASSGTFLNAGAESNSDTLNWELNSWEPGAEDASSFYGAKQWINGETNNCPETFRIRVLDTSNTEILRKDITLTDGYAVTEHTIDTSTIPYSMIKLYFDWTGDTANSTRRSSAFIRPQNIKIKVKDGNPVSVGNNCYPQFDIDESSFTLNANYTSPIFDTYISTPIWGLFAVDLTSSAVHASTGSVAFRLRVSTANDGGGFDSFVTPTNNLEPAVNSKRYGQYDMRWEVNSTTQTNPTVRSVDLTAASTGHWRSPELFLNSALSTWGQFQTVQSVLGSEASIAYCVRASTAQGKAGHQPCVAVTPGVAMSLSTGAYVIVESTYTIGVATETARTDTIVLNYNVGSTARSASSAVFKNRMHYGGQSSTGTVNDVIYVLDTNGAWSKWTGLYPRHLNVVNQSLVLGVSSETTSSGGFLYGLYESDADDGQAISAFWESKDFVGGALQNLKSAYKLFIVPRNDNTDVNVTLKVDGGVQRSSDTLSFQCDDSSQEFCVKSINFEPAINGNTFRFRFDNNAASAPWEIKAFGAQFRDIGEMQP